jgi:hypothetical protein
MGSKLSLPGLDGRALTRIYGMDAPRKPQWKLATFRAPLGATQSQYEKLRDKAIEKTVRAMSKQGWDLLADTNHRPKVSPGVYPAWDLRDNVAILDQREFVLGMWFTFRNPKPVRLELPPHLLRPVTVQN